MKKIVVAAIALFGLTACPDSKSGPTAEERAEQKAADIVERGLGAKNEAAAPAADAAPAAEADEAEGGPQEAEPVTEK